MFSSMLAYEFADRVVVALADSERYLQDFLASKSSEFKAKARRPHKITLLHHFLKNLNYADFEYLTGHCPEENLSKFSRVFAAAAMQAPDWLNGDRVRDHTLELDNLLLLASERIAYSAFQLLFSDLVFLGQFGQLVAMRINDTMEMQPVERPHYLPQWLRRAVFHRDRGRCRNCYKDLTGLLEPTHDIQLDHIMPLVAGGSNDPTNFQLLCKSCNLKKSTKPRMPSPRTFLYW